MAHSFDAWMRDNEITDAVLADRIGVSRPFITRIRSGQRQPSLPVAAKLAAETRLPITSFIRGQGIDLASQVTRNDLEAFR